MRKFKLYDRRTRTGRKIGQAVDAAALVLIVVVVLAVALSD